MAIPIEIWLLGDGFGSLEHFLFLPFIGNVIIPIDELIFFRGILGIPSIPPTSSESSTMRAIEISCLRFCFHIFCLPQLA